MSNSGIGAMVQAAAFCETQLGMEILSFGRGGLEPENSHVLEICGRSLLYIIKLDGCERILLQMQLLDSAAEPRLFLNIDDSESGWKTVAAVIRALEEENVDSLERPIELGGGTGPKGFVIA